MIVIGCVIESQFVPTRINFQEQIMMLEPAFIRLIDYYFSGRKSFTMATSNKTIIRILLLIINLGSERYHEYYGKSTTSSTLY